MLGKISSSLGVVGWLVHFALPVLTLSVLVPITVLYTSDYIRNIVPILAIGIPGVSALLWSLEFPSVLPRKRIRYTGTKGMYSIILMRDVSMVLIYQWVVILMIRNSRQNTETYADLDFLRHKNITDAIRLLYSIITTWNVASLSRHKKSLPLYVTVCILSVQLYVTTTFFVRISPQNPELQPTIALAVLFMAPVLNWLRRLSWDVYCALSSHYRICGVSIPVLNLGYIADIHRLRFFHSGIYTHVSVHAKLFVVATAVAMTIYAADSSGNTAIEMYKSHLGIL